MDKFILITYELQGKEGKILVREGKTEREIKEYCVIDRLEKINKENHLVSKVKIINKGE